MSKLAKAIRENGDMLDKYQPRLKNFKEEIKERESDGHTPESIASLHNVSVQDILDQIEKGIKVEREHTSDEAEARIIAMDHLVELPDYYTRLDKMEEEGKKDLEDTIINESAGIDATQIMKMSLRDLIKYNDGDMHKTLQDINTLMTRLQGTEDTKERKAYFKARKLYAALVAHMNKGT